jgi:hypothetical protein
MSFLWNKIKYIKENYLIEMIVLIITGIILLNTLFIYPVVGKSDNGDFVRLYTFAGLKDLGTTVETHFDGYFHLKYLISGVGSSFFTGRNWTFGVIILKAAVFFQSLFSGFKNTLFDIRYQTFIYCLLFLAALFLIMRFSKLAKGLKLAAGILFILFFTDVGYIAYFNSFFGEAAVITFFFLSFGTFLYLISRENPEPVHFILFFLASAGFLTSKTQEIPLLLFMLIVYGGLYGFYKEKKQRITVIAGSLLVIALCVNTYMRIDDYVNKCNLYQSVFTGVLKDSKTPEEDLKKLGLDTKFSVLAGTNFFQNNLAYDQMGKELLEGFYPKVSTFKVLAFYLKNPDRLWQKMNASAKNAYEFYYLNKSNFAKGQFTESKPVNNFRLKLANSNKYKPLQNNIYIFIGFSAVFFGVITFYFFKSRERYTRLLMIMLLFILAAGASQSVLPFVGSGEADFGKHLFLINLAYDTMLIVTIIWILNFAKNSLHHLTSKRK